MSTQLYDNVAVARFVRSLRLAHAAPMISRVAEGVSTAVYRVDADGRTYYLRILPEPNASFAPEVAVHQRLRVLGLHVPEVVFYEHRNELFQRSVMLTTAVAGRAVGYHQQPAAIRRIVYAAGRELAAINQVPVQGYGWMRRDTPELSLRAEHLSLPAWIREDFEAPIRALGETRHFTRAQVGALLGLLDTACNQLQGQPAALAHGDFDATHIYWEGDNYTGMIDFGEIRGAHPLYDLGHFAIENGDLLADLLKGYGEVALLHGGAMRQIQLSAILIAARRIGRRALQKREPHPPDVAFVVRMLGRLRPGDGG